MTENIEKSKFFTEILTEEQYPQWEAFLADQERIGAQKELNESVCQANFADLHQSLAWAKFQKNAGIRGEFWIIVVREEEGGEIVAGSVVFAVRLRGGRSWLYSPRGPVGDFCDQEVWKEMEVAMAKLAVEEKAIFWRIEPAIILDKTENVRQQWLARGWKNAHAHYQPESSLCLDLTQSEQWLLSQMKPKGRYNIKLAEKKEVTVRKAGIERLPEFYQLIEATTVRDGFSGHKINYYQTMLETLGDDCAQLWLAEYENQVIAGMIVTFYGKQATYYFGASANQFRNLMAPYLLQWEVIRAAKEKGMEVYDFLGIAPLGSGEKHPWAGVSDFKLKFGGSRLDYWQGLEKIYSPGWLTVMRLAKLVLKLKNVFARK